ncbi:hypothetical protein SynA1562_01885 [Synechococcus sp. A15-62]|nr:hypothetical protein SynA1562_01885 [Synechococcus sp. A15-62]
MRVINDWKRQRVVSPGMAQPIQGLGRLLVQQQISRLRSQYTAEI